MKLYSIRTSLTALLVLLTLLGCAQMQLRTAWALRDVDLLSLSPGVVRLAVSMPYGAVLDEATLTLQFSRDNEVELDHEIQFDLLTTGHEVERVGFPGGARTGVVVFRLPASRLNDIVDFQKIAREAREAGLDASMSVGIGSRFNSDWMKQYCAKGTAEFRVRAWVLVDDLEGYLPLIKESELMKLLNDQSRSFCQEYDE